tara:strand:+ start:96 stop:917 length:822 start_codon:yes stop_codon:yes gene_type:complete
MKNIKNTLSELHLNDNETVRINCPLCKGHKTFTVSKVMGNLLWNCYRVGCTVSGKSKTNMTATEIKNKLFVEGESSFSSFPSSFSLGSSPTDNFLMPEHVIKDDNKIKTFVDKYKLHNQELYYDVKDNRVVFPVIHDSKIVDATGRSLGNKKPKWLRYGKSDLPFVFGHGSVAVVVEDCVSASVIGNEVFVGVAVLGTSLLTSHKKYLSQFSTAIIALDPDAIPKTLQFFRELTPHVDSVRAMKLIDDLKYRNPTDLENLDQHRRLIYGTVTD